jgi:hypothetical protein
MRKLLASTALGAMLTFAGSANAAVNLLVNGSFETGNFTGWTLSGNTGFLGVTTSFSGVLPQDGKYEVFGGSVGSDLIMSQTFTDIAGDAYTATGWVYGFGGDPSDFGISVGGSSIFLSPYPPSGWTEYTVVFVGSGSDTLTIRNRNDPSYQLLDNFAIINSTIPEASTWAMMMIGFAGLGFAGYRSAKNGRSAFAA